MNGDSLTATAIKLPMLVAWLALRTLHVVAGTGWLGEVITVNFVLLPALFKARANDRLILLNIVFPYVFGLATVLGGVAIATGLALLMWKTGLNLSILTYSLSGWLVIVGGGMAIGLYIFHLLEESGLERSLAANIAFAVGKEDEAALKKVMTQLAIFPRGGMVILLIVVGLMIAALRM